ncbi:MAG TPA: POTRA domain-containing protein [Candidatus Acidoferrum sp.]|nr:POTRA domain-containing protein [Candidatus Acidoferrum sp.]
MNTPFRTHLLPVIALFLIAFTSTANAHSRRPPQASGKARIGRIRVTGQKRFTPEQIISATGLAPGQIFDAEALNAAAEKIGKSGAFTDVTYSYAADAGSMSIDFKVAEAEKFRPCIFDNFVWLTDDEIEAGLKKAIPLYTGVAPETGEMLDRISTALEKLSQEKGVTVRVTRRIGEAAIGDPNWSHLYSAEGPDLKIQSFRFDGTNAVKPEELERIAERSAGGLYSKYRCVLVGNDALLPIYRERGYLGATISPPSVTVLSRASDSSAFSVQVEYKIEEGSVYKWGATAWAGNTALDAGALDKLTGMRANDIANEKMINEGWVAVRKAYSKAGYFEVQISPQPVLDPPNLLVHYHVVVVEGPIYHMGQLTFAGIDAKLIQELERHWRLKAGDTFDSSYAGEFLKNEVFPALQAEGKRNARVAVMTKPDKQNHVVNVSLTVE